MSEQSYQQALQDFRRARQEAAMRQLLHRLTGRTNSLLAYGDIAEKLKVTATVEHGLREIPLDAIVGSVGRADDFTRDFLPRRDSDAERWARVKAAVLDMKGWPPIEVYQLGEVYFVKDGNHRVSVARQLGNKTITARVTEVKTRLPLDAQRDPAQIICRANYLHFLEVTALHLSHPEVDLSMTFCDQYDVLLAQIEAYQRKLAEWEDRELTYDMAASRWYEEVYWPLVKEIRAQGALRNFEERTETDLYLLLSERQDELEQALGWRVSRDKAIANLARQLQGGHTSPFARLGGRVREIVLPQLEEGPPPGHWRRLVRASPRDRALFGDILVSLQGTEADWRLLDETIFVARREGARILAVHAVDGSEELDSEDTRCIRATFLQRCHEAGIEGQFAAEVGVEGTLMIERAPWVDLVATNLTFATEGRPLARLSSGVSTLIQRCPRPILVFPVEDHSPMDHVLLAYDGSPKADEALFVATYLALRWQARLTVVTVRTQYTTPHALERARSYLSGQQLLGVDYVLKDKPITGAILKTAASSNANLLLMGGFGLRPVQHMMLGSTVDEILQLFDQPVLICR